MNIDQYLMEAILIPMMVLGIFGNLNVIVAIARKKILRTKGAMLVFVLAISHLICNLSELKILLFRLRFQTKTGRECYLYNIPYSLAVMFQSALFLSMSLDLCFCIMVPIKHMLWPKTKYVLIMCIMPTCFTLTIFALNFIYVNDEIAPYCAFMLTMEDGVFEIISNSVVTCNILTFVISVMSVAIAMKKSQEMRNHRHSSLTRRNSTVQERRKIFRSTFFMMVVYILCWMVSSICFRLMIAFFENEKDIAPYMPYIAIIIMPNFCQAYFVTLSRSARFRKAYREHFNWLSCGCLYKDIFERPDIRGGESGSKHDSATNPQLPTETEKKLKDVPKKSVKIYEGEVI